MKSTAIGRLQESHVVPKYLTGLFFMAWLAVCPVIEDAANKGKQQEDGIH
jgi:hypothetical protein